LQIRKFKYHNYYIICVLSNNSRKECSIYETRNNIPDHVIELLKTLEELISPFHIKIKSQGNTIKITLQEKEHPTQKGRLRCITLSLFEKPKSYLINLYDTHNSAANHANKERFKQIYEIKVEGDYELKSIEKDVKKLIEGRNLTHHRKYYPF
jgi:hypothetical protein